MIDNFNNGCDNCKHYNKPLSEEPCNNCFDFSGNNKHWERDPALKSEKLDVASLYPEFCEIALPELMAIFDKKENKNMKKQQKRRNRNILVVKKLNTAIEFAEIKFNGPATIIMWQPTHDQWAYGKKGDKTVVVCKEPDKFDKTTGFLLAVLKELLDNQSYGNILEKIDEINKENKE